jgi:hypothetical protein
MGYCAIPPYTQTVSAGAFSLPPETEAPRWDEWPALTKERIVRIAAWLAIPPELFVKYPELVSQNPILSQILMTNFWAFQRWIDLQPAILERLTIAGRASKVPGGSPLSQMIATEWVRRGRIISAVVWRCNGATMSQLIRRTKGFCCETTGCRSGRVATRRRRHPRGPRARSGTKRGRVLRASSGVGPAGRHHGGGPSSRESARQAHQSRGR